MSNNTQAIRKRQAPQGQVEWIDARQTFHLFSLGRSVLERLEREGKIRACSLADEGMKRGKKLYDAASIRSFLNARATAAAIA